jgi:pyruvate dehydrogenase E2 component (dihydrolipoamide acetyltransferase)
MAEYETIYPVQRETGKPAIPPGETIELSSEEAAPLLERGAIKVAGASTASHDPEQVGFEGQEPREKAQERAGDTATEGSAAEATEGAKKKAEEFGVDLAHVQGTGPGGRINQSDVERAAKEREE